MTQPRCRTHFEPGFAGTAAAETVPLSGKARVLVMGGPRGDLAQVGTRLSRSSPDQPESTSASASRQKYRRLTASDDSRPGPAKLRW